MNRGGTSSITRALLALSSRIVPAPDRAEWRKEWEAELQASRPSLGRVRIVLRTLAAPVDAARFRMSALRLHMVGMETRHAWRGLSRRPIAWLGVTSLVAGAVAAWVLLVVLVQGVLHQPEAWADPVGVALVGPVNLAGPDIGTSVAVAELVRMESERSSAIAWAGVDVVRQTLLEGRMVEEVQVARVSASLFDLLGVPMTLGRFFTMDEDVPGGANVAVVAYHEWRTRYGADPTIVGRGVELGAERRTIVGVTGPGFVLPSEVGDAQRSRYFLPLRVDRADPGPVFVKNLDAVVARVRPSASVEALDLDVKAVAAGLIADHPENYREDEWTLQARSPRDVAVAHVRPTLGLLLGAAALMVLAVCTNLAGLLHTRWLGRRGDTAVRRALGAPVLHLRRRLLIEGVTAGAPGLLGGWLLAAVLLAPLREALVGVVPRAMDVRFSVLAAASASALVLGAIGVGVWAAARRVVVDHVADELRSHGSARATPRTLLIGQLALATTLLLASAVLLRSVMAYTKVDLGFEPSRVAVAQVRVAPERAPSASDVERVFAEIVGTLGETPGVSAAGMARRVPIADGYGTWTAAVRAEGEPRRLDDAPPRWQVVSSGFFEALGLNAVEGRLFTAADEGGGPSAVVVNQSFAETVWPGRSAVGTHLRLDGGPENPWLEVIGVVNDVRSDGPAARPTPTFYVAHADWAAATSIGAQRTMSLVIRTDPTASDPHTLIRGALGQVDPQIPVRSFATMPEIVRGSFVETRLVGTIVGAFALLAISLGGIGVYVVMASDVVARRRELGIRMALGADRIEVTRAVVMDGVRTALLGAALGVVAGWAAAHLLDGFLFGVAARDPLSFVAVPLIVAAVSASASVLPAIQASKEDPSDPLRAN